MFVGLHDSDNTGFPNYALMKISAYHKARGDTVGWFIPLMQYDKVYSSKVFTFTPEYEYLPPDTVKGGTGYGIYGDLQEEIDRMQPDYSIYPNTDYAVGFLTRGCVRKCPWCIVPQKEGAIRPYQTWREIKRADKRNIIFMDNNVLACQHGIEQMEDMIGHDLRIDFNQGIDARLITPEIAEIIAKLKWIRFIRLACDTDDMLGTVLEKAELLQKFGVKPYRIFVYVLVQDISSAEKRVLALRDAGMNPFAQPYRDFENNAEPEETAKAFARWVNVKSVFKSADSFSEYSTHIRGHNKNRVGGVKTSVRIFIRVYVRDNNYYIPRSSRRQKTAGEKGQKDEDRQNHRIRS